jgi:HAE1 family hydrophobic/amphiphilic exporter-1
MHSVVRFTLRQQVLFNLIFVVMIVVGSFVVGGLAVERYPEVNFGKAIITTFYPGASPRDVEALVTSKLEDAIDGLEEVEFVRASSVRERSTITVKFRDDTDYDRLYDELRFRVLSAIDELPADVEPPAFSLIDTSFWLPVVSVNLVGERSNRALTLIAEELKTPLSRIAGVDEAAIVGERTRRFDVALDPGKLADYGVTFDEVSRALRDANLVIPAGDYTDASGEYVIRVDERFRSRAQIVETIVRRDGDGSFVRVGDLITSAALGYRDPHVINSVNGLDTVAVQVKKGRGGNALDIMREVRAIVDDFAPVLQQEGVQVVLTQDSTTYIEESVGTLGWNMIVGICLVGLILWYYMGPRNAGLVSVGIPFAFLVTMIMMWMTGNSLNEITLFSFVLVSGIVVDDAIVVTENIYRHVQDGEPLHEAIVNGTAEVMLPVISATATTVAAFLPMLLMTGSTGEFFALIPKAVTFAIVASLFECLLILPLHYLHFGPRPGPRKEEHQRDDLTLRLLRRMTRRVVGWTLHYRWTTLSMVGIAFVASVSILAVSVAGVAPLIRIKFFPDDYNIYYVFVEGPADTALEAVDERVRAISEAVMADGAGYARSAAGFAGFVVNEDYEQEFGHNLGTVMVALPAKGERAFDDPITHLDDIRVRMVEAFADARFDIRVRAEKDGPPSGKDVNIQIIGNDEAAVAGLADALSAAMRADPVLSKELIQLDDGRSLPARVLSLDVDEPRALESGLTKGQAATLAAAVLDGRYVGEYRLSDEEVDLYLRLDPAFLDTPERALEIPVLQHPAGPVLLGDIVRPRPQIQPSELKRYRGQRSRTITANIRAGANSSPASVAAFTREQYRALRARYPGATLVFGGEFEETQRSFRSLFQAFGLAILIIYVILAAQFKSYAQPVIVLSAVMFSIIGVVLGKFMTQSLFTVNSFIAVVGVTGVVVNDSLVLIDFINRGYREGLERGAAIRRGIELRLRPIFLTTLTTTLGLLPMALGIPSYSVIWGSMASTFVTGLATATLLTLFVVPVGWDLLMERRERRASRPRSPDAAEQERA